MTFSVDLDAVTALIRSTAETHILPRFRKLAAHEIHEKGPGNGLVTIADIEAERALTPALEKLIPGSLVVGEEAVAHDAAILDRLAGDDPVWIIDPVDGTMNFTKAIPRFAVIIALVARGAVQAGWIQDPLQGITVVATAGGGAWLNTPGQPRRRLRYGPARPLRDARGAAYARMGERGRTHDILERSGQVGPIRRINSAGQEYLDLAQGELDYAIGYVRERKQFGRAVADFQGLQFMIADMAMKLEAARQLTYAAAAKSERAMAGEKIDDLTFFSSACKCLASDVAMSVTTDAVQLLGGYGYVNDYPVERMMRDAKITQIYEGTNQIQRMVMARQLLK